MALERWRVVRLAPRRGTKTSRGMTEACHKIAGAAVKSLRELGSATAKDENEDDDYVWVRGRWRHAEPIESATIVNTSTAPVKTAKS